jgi:D-alanyl-D-alanine carboxypeptidase (penicillin-binding protein 5/6)
VFVFIDTQIVPFTINIIRLKEQALHPADRILKAIGQMSSTVRHLIVSILVVLFFFPYASAFGGDSHSSRAIPVVTTVHKSSLSSGQSNAVAEQADTILVVSSSAKNRPAEPLKERIARLKKVTAQSVVVMDGNSGHLLYAKSPDQPRQPASTIKILTGLLAMEALQDEAKVPVSRRAARMPRSKIYLDQRKTYQADDLINAVLLASANDASVALAEWVAGTERKFANLMTRKAQELGARNTLCRTASGLTARGQYSTARDLAIIFGQAMQNNEFAARVKQIKAKTKEGTTLRNHNKALWSISGAEGGKTGYTRAAQQTYVGQFKRNVDTIVVAIMGSNTMWNDIRRLVDYGFAKKRQLRLAEKDEKSASPRLAMESPADISETPSTRTDIQPLVDNKKIAKL